MILSLVNTCRNRHNSNVTQNALSQPKQIYGCFTDEFVKIFLVDDITFDFDLI